METKVIILGESEAEKPELKKIEFVKYLDSNFERATCVTKPSEYENIVLLRKHYGLTGLDLMYAYGENPDLGILYLGHFNDGVV